MGSCGRFRGLREIWPPVTQAEASQNVTVMDPADECGNIIALGCLVESGTLDNLF